MKMSKEKFANALSVARFAVHNQDFVPILSHFCFDKKTVTAYNDQIAIRLTLKTNLRCAVKADTLLGLVNSVSADEVEITENSDTVVIKCGSVNAKLPIMHTDDFVFTLPPIKKLDAGTPPSDAVEKMSEGMKVLLPIVGDNYHHPSQLGVTLKEDERKNGTLRMYATNGKSIGVYSFMGWDPIGIKDAVVPSQFVKAMIKAFEEFGTEDVVFRCGKDFMTVSVGKRAVLFTKLIANHKPLDFDGTIKRHCPKWWKKALNPIPQDFVDAIKRSNSILSTELGKSARFEVDDRKITICADSKLAQVRSRVKLKRPAGVQSFYVDIPNISRAVEATSQVAFVDTCSIFYAPPAYKVLVAVTNHPEGGESEE